jgi:hypothetical protein
LPNFTYSIFLLLYNTLFLFSLLSSTLIITLFILIFKLICIIIDLIFLLKREETHEYQTDGIHHYTGPNGKLQPGSRKIVYFPAHPDLPGETGGTGGGVPDLRPLGKRSFPDPGRSPAGHHPGEPPYGTPQSH